MLGDSSSTALGSSSGDAPAAAPASSAAAAHRHDGSSEEDRMKLGGGGDEFGDRSFGGNRWPRQETIALLKIRSDMDVVFRDASVKGPLWEDVSRSENNNCVCVYNTYMYVCVYVCVCKRTS